MRRALFALSTLSIGSAAFSTPAAACAMKMVVEEREDANLVALMDEILSASGDKSLTEALAGVSGIQGVPEVAPVVPEVAPVIPEVAPTVTAPQAPPPVPNS